MLRQATQASGGKGSSESTVSEAASSGSKGGSSGGDQLATEMLGLPQVDCIISQVVCPHDVCLEGSVLFIYLVHIVFQISHTSPMYSIKSRVY